MNDVSLVIMAAGLGSRYNGGIKQIEPFGPNGEILMEYSIYDAIQAGFNKVIFVLREDILEDFKNTVGKRVEAKIKTEYVVQKIDDIPSPYKIENRVKPWGTGQAILVCKNKINEPFCVINADDYYGEKSFKLIHDFLISNKENNEYCMAGFILKNTLSNNGGVKRGICKVDNNGYLVDIDETFDIKREGSNITSNNGLLDENAKASMNMWGFKPSMLAFLENGFVNFLEKNINEPSSEYLIPTIVDNLLKEEKIKVKVLETDDNWFGITYKEDYEETKKSLVKLYQKGKYKDM